MPETIIITGASDGIGAAAARALSAGGRAVVIVGRSPGKTARIAGELGADHLVADYSRLGDVRRLADVLANNAGGVFRSHAPTEDGHEPTFQLNYLAPFLLTNLLMDRLVTSHARVINTSSGANLGARLDIDNLDSTSRVYSNAKLAVILFTKELARRGIPAAAFHPGVVATHFARDFPMHGLFERVASRFLIPPEKGADTLLWLATTQPGVDWVPGEYYYKRQVGRVNAQAAAAGLARNLWDRTSLLVS
jgi:NAD(P)-dependent dehydrogenase (short-subunit alcohol dehydrogenase family)